MSFEDEVDNAVAAMSSYMGEVRKGAILDLCDRVIDDTPVLTGALRGSWRASQGEAVLDPSPRIDPDGEAPKAEARENIGDGSQDFFLANALPYSEAIEYDGVSHTKAPEGMVRKNLALFPGIVADFSSSRE